MPLRQGTHLSCCARDSQVYAYGPHVIINSAPLHSQKCLGLYDKLYVHLTPEALMEIKLDNS